jgi:hypothetical protein
MLLRSLSSTRWSRVTGLLQTCLLITTVALVASCSKPAVDITLFKDVTKQSDLVVILA